MRSVVVGKIHVYYGLVGAVLVVGGLTAFLALLRWDERGAFCASLLELWPWLLVLILAGLWYGGNVVFGLAVYHGRQWAFGQVGMIVGIVELFLLPTGPFMGVYWLRELRSLGRDKGGESETLLHRLNTVAQVESEDTPTCGRMWW